MDVVNELPSSESGKVITGNSDDEYDLDRDDEINALENTDSMPSLFLNFFEIEDIKFSSIISLEASLLNTEINIGRTAVTSSSVSIGFSLETFKYFPLKFKPFSIISLVSIKTVSGIKLHSPVFEILSSPARCISVMSFGNTLNSRFSEKTARDVSDKIPSTPFLP